MIDTRKLIAVIHEISHPWFLLMVPVSNCIWTTMKDNYRFKIFQKILKFFSNQQYNIWFRVIINMRIICNPPTCEVITNGYKPIILCIVGMLVGDSIYFINEVQVSMKIFNSFTKTTYMFSNNHVRTSLEYNGSFYQEYGIDEDDYKNAFVEAEIKATIKYGEITNPNRISYLNTFNRFLDEEVCTILWCRFLSELVEVVPVLGSLDLSKNNLKKLPENFGNITAKKWINLLGNPLHDLPDNRVNSASWVLDWCVLSLEQQKDLINWFAKNPVHITCVQNYCTYNVCFEQGINVDNHDVRRFVGLKPGLGNLTDDQSFQLLIEVHQHCRNTGKDITCIIKENTNRVLSEFVQSVEIKDKLRGERQSNLKYKRDFTPFVIS